MWTSGWGPWCVFYRPRRASDIVMVLLSSGADDFVYTETGNFELSRLAAQRGTASLCLYIFCLCWPVYCCTAFSPEYFFFFLSAIFFDGCRKALVAPRCFVPKKGKWEVVYPVRFLLGLPYSCFLLAKSFLTPSPG